LLTDDGMYERMSAAARQTALTKFDTPMVIPQYEAHYQQVLSA